MKAVYINNFFNHILFPITVLFLMISCQTPSGQKPKALPRREGGLDQRINSRLGTGGQAAEGPTSDNQLSTGQTGGNGNGGSLGTGGNGSSGGSGINSSGNGESSTNQHASSEEGASVDAENNPWSSDIPKIGLILGPGGARTFAYISLLQEMQKNKIPIHAVAGIEFGSPMAALYAWKGFANDVEWQMMKLKTEDFPKRWIDPSSVESFLSLVFQKTKVEELKLPFACPAHNLEKNQIFVMSRGTLSQLIPYCLPYPPVMKPYSNNVSGVRDIKTLADYLRSQGANFIVYVNVLNQSRGQSLFGDKDSMENIMWTEIATTMAGLGSKPQSGVDYLLNLNVENYAIMDFVKKREITQKSQEAAKKSVQILARKLNL